jgi:hypothetical protein
MYLNCKVLYLVHLLVEFHLEGGVRMAMVKLEIGLNLLGVIGPRE